MNMLGYKGRISFFWLPYYLFNKLLYNTNNNDNHQKRLILLGIPSLSKKCSNERISIFYYYQQQKCKHHQKKIQHTTTFFIFFIRIPSYHHHHQHQTPHGPAFLQEFFPRGCFAFCNFVSTLDSYLKDCGGIRSEVMMPF